jgi:AraC family transcriptional regulator
VTLSLMTESTLPLARSGPLRTLVGKLAELEAPASSLGSFFHVPLAQTAVTTTLNTSQIRVTRITSPDGIGTSDPLPIEKAYLAVLHLQDCIGSELWKAGRLASTIPFMAGSLIISRLEDEPTFRFLSGFDFILLKIPEIVLDELTDYNGAPRIHTLRSEARAYDAILHHLARVMIHALETATPPCNQFFEHLARAICLKLAQRYGERATRIGISSPAALGLAQTRLAKDLLAGDLTEQPRLDHIAKMCGMTVGRFVRAFREATGLPPYRWLRAFRLERAKELMLGGSLSLAQIAYECGFADQSHFTRVFSQAVSMTPAAWRRACCG